MCLGIISFIQSKVFLKKIEINYIVNIKQTIQYNIYINIYYINKIISLLFQWDYVFTF